jgi:hypothetical protein
MHRRYTFNQFQILCVTSVNYNESEFSDIIAVIRPDTIPPVTPVFNDVVVREKEVELHFVQSTSLDVKEHIIYRKTDMNAGWETLRVINYKTEKYLDTSVTKGVTYYYSMRAKDLGGLYSPYAAPVFGKPYDTGIRPPVENLVANVADKKIVLTWNYPAKSKDVFFVIYKKNEQGQLVQYATATERTFTDKNAEKENFFTVKARTPDGGQSKMSDVVGIKME